MQGRARGTQPRREGFYPSPVSRGPAKQETKRGNSAGTGARVTGVPRRPTPAEDDRPPWVSKSAGALPQSRHNGQRRLPRDLRNLDTVAGHTNSRGQKTVKGKTDLKETAQLCLTWVPVPRPLGPGQAPHCGPICLLPPPGPCSRCSPTWHTPSSLPTYPSVPLLQALLGGAPCGPGIYLFTSTQASSHPFIHLFNQTLPGPSYRRAGCQV